MTIAIAYNAPGLYEVAERLACISFYSIENKPTITKHPAIW